MQGLAKRNDGWQALHQAQRENGERTELRSLNTAISSIKWEDMPPLESNEHDAWVLAARSGVGGFLHKDFWETAEWFAVPLHSLTEFTHEASSDGYELHVSWSVWETDDILNTKPFTVYPPFFLDLDNEAEEMPLLPELAEEIQRWLVTTEEYFPQDDIVVDFTGAKGVHIRAKAWHSHQFTMDSNPLMMRRELRAAIQERDAHYNCDPMHLMYRAPNSTYILDGHSWRTKVVGARDLVHADEIARNLAEMWDESGYWDIKQKSE